MKRLKIIVAVVLVAYFAFGFWGFSSSGLDQKIIVEGFCVSKAENSNKAQTYDFALLNSENSKTKSTVTLTADDFNSACKKLREQTAGDPFFGQVQYVLVNDNLGYADIKENLKYFSSKTIIPPGAAVFTVTQQLKKSYLKKGSDTRFYQALSNMTAQSKSTLMAATTAVMENKPGLLRLDADANGEIKTEEYKR
ncbi:MAG: hypothetical protein LBM65_06435 [Oscillospiraceae bacterium]|jgi:hypothetical protein|nr:hypothetical protein [Oscillospiraceae bacterium]